MLFRRISALAFRAATVFGAALCFAPGDAAAATARAAVPTPEAPSAIAFTIYDSIADPSTAAIRRELLGSGRGGAFLDKRDAAAVAEFYAGQGYAPSWTADGRLSDRARTVIGRLAKADEDGLDPEVYRIPPLDVGGGTAGDPVALAEADVRLSLAVVTYVRHAYSGRIDPSAISPNFGYEPHLPDSVAALAEVASASDPAGVLDSYSPPQEQYRLLRAKLAEERSAGPSERPIEIPAGPTLKPGASDPRVPLLRQRLAVGGDASAPELYDGAVVAAVESFQRDAGLKPDGAVGKATLAALNRAPVDPIPVIIANMERWRWMPRDLGRFHVRVSIPDFTVYVVRDGTVAYSTRIVVGKVKNETPIFSDQIEHIIVNPAWNVPASIARNEMLPAAQADPASLDGYQVFANIEGRYKAVDPRLIDWHTVDIRKIQIRQPPGEQNALGNIKFMFPNPYSVYLHDTPSKSLFQRDYRAFSHGCMRVMDPMAFADALLAGEPKLNSAVLTKLIGGPETQLNLTRPVPVHITYFTASVTGDGKLVIRDDLYGHDKAVELALGL